jgi:HK97 family phage prohead protease
MGALRGLFGAPGPVTFAADPPGNVITGADVASLFGIELLTDWTSPAARIDRASAIQVPGVKRARDLICGTVGRLPYVTLASDFTRGTRPLLDQPERNRAGIVTMTQTAEDLLFEGIAWWRVVERDYDRWPTKVARLDPRSVNVQPSQRVYVRGDGTPQGNAWEYVEDRDLIRFDSPNDALLDAGARAIRTALKLDAAAANYADDPMPQGWFEPAEGADPSDDDEIEAALGAWRAARRRKATGYVPAALKYQSASWSPADLQLADARQHAVLEIARVAGVDPEDLGVSTTSRTYQNGVDRRQSLLDFTIGAYLDAVTGRLSLGDVTPRGTKVVADTTRYLRADDLTRFQTYKAMQEVGAIDDAGILQREELPMPKRPRPPAVAPPAADPPAPDNVRPLRSAAAGAEGATFDAGDRLTIGFAAGEPVQVDVTKRTITGLAVPYGVTASKGGRSYRFSAGSLVLPSNPSAVKALMDHDRTQAVGVLRSAVDGEDGMRVALGIAATPEGDRALQLAKDGVYDGLSIGLAEGAQFAEADDGTLDAMPGGAPLAEVTLTPFPAFTDARVSSVAASIDGGSMTTTTAAPPAPAPPAPPAEVITLALPGGATYSLPAGTAPEAVASFAAALGVTAPARPEVIPAGAPVATVVEAAPYRFDGSRGEHDFSADLIAWSRGDSSAGNRLNAFIGERFAVTTTNAQYLNPQRQRPDMWVGDLQYRYPIWAAINNGTLSDITSFRLPKFNSAGSLVADHTEGNEPSGGSFTTTYQDITPTAMSGKVVINREVWDQGGSPQLSQLLWAKVEDAWYESLETKAADLLDATGPTVIALSGVDATLSGAWTDALSDLQFIRGGYRFDDFIVSKALFKAFTGATDDNGRPLFPMINPTNANGSTDRRFRYVDAGGVQAVPGWALEVANGGDGSSYLFAREDVHGWATPPQRIDMPNIAVATVTIGVWGYAATACTRAAGVREVTYS